MELLTQSELNIVCGADYGFCEVMRDGTVGFFTTAGAIVGGATTFGAGAHIGGFLGHMLGSWAGDNVYKDCKVTTTDE